MRRAISLLAGLLLLSACAPEPEPANPALWEVTGPDGGKGWLFGTVHALERPVAWRTPEVGRALDASGVILVEVADLADGKSLAATFSELATSPGHPPLSARIGPEARPALRAVLDQYGLSNDGFSKTETWAAALTIAQAAARGQDSANGVDRAVIAAVGERPVVELEGARGQLALFDRLPESEQADLLEAVVADAESLEGESADLIAAWREGDMDVIAAETEKGLLADPELREALFTKRNAAWTRRIASDIAGGRRPFVAVGAAHMAGPDGLPAMLNARGFSVSRVQ